VIPTARFAHPPDLLSLLALFAASERRTSCAVDDDTTSWRTSSPIPTCAGAGMAVPSFKPRSRMHGQATAIMCPCKSFVKDMHPWVCSPTLSFGRQLMGNRRLTISDRDGYCFDNCRRMEP
jgi:hypothetical protein